MSFVWPPRDAKLSLLHYQAHVVSEYSSGVNRDSTVGRDAASLFDNLCPPRMRTWFQTPLQRSTMRTYDVESLEIRIPQDISDAYKAQHCRWATVSISTRKPPSAGCPTNQEIIPLHFLCFSDCTKNGFTIFIRGDSKESLEFIDEVVVLLQGRINVAQTLVLRNAATKDGLIESLLPLSKVQTVIVNDATLAKYIPRREENHDQMQWITFYKVIIRSQLVKSGNNQLLIESCDEKKKLKIYLTRMRDMSENLIYKCSIKLIVSEIDINRYSEHAPYSSRVDLTRLEYDSLMTEWQSAGRRLALEMSDLKECTSLSGTLTPLGRLLTDPTLRRTSRDAEEAIAALEERAAPLLHIEHVRLSVKRARRLVEEVGKAATRLESSFESRRATIRNLAVLRSIEDQAHEIERAMLRTMAYNEEGQRVLAKKWVSPNNCLIVRSKHFDQAYLAFTYGWSRSYERETKKDIQNCLISIAK
ncbi:hypothetical protein ALC53_05322 [Atta colombica]|uniref:Uncharacterized protein n=1 Tax=Atta colombica TaxID=520822 RepID=A0A195BI83_9HYME|nr:hypothetical protein ALC53_05322 [Atta colombica]